MKHIDIPELRNLGPKLEDIRKNSGKSQEQFAADYGVAQGTMSKYENGQTHPPVTLIALICKDYWIDPNFFFDWDEETSKRMGLPPRSRCSPITASKKLVGMCHKSLSSGFQNGSQCGIIKYLDTKEVPLCLREPVRS